MLVPAILAVAQARGGSGASMLTAYLAGYETWAALAGRDQDQYHLKGWHPAGIFGPIAAAAAAASMLRLDPSHAARALALAASQSGGIVANFGTMTKAFHVGRAAQAGVSAAVLAEAGMTASEDALERPLGFLEAVSPRGRVDVETPLRTGPLDGQWSLLDNGLAIKRYPTCYCASRPLDGLFDLLGAHPTAPSTIAGIEISMSGRNSRLLRYEVPKTSFEAKYSMQFLAAAAVIAGEVALDTLKPAFILRPDVQALMRKVTLAIDDREDPVTGYAPFDRATIRLADGATLVGNPVTVAKGSPAAPLSAQELYAKFSSCSRYGEYDGNARSLFETLMHLDQLDDVSALHRSQAITSSTSPTQNNS